MSLSTSLHDLLPPLTPEKEALLEALFEAHTKAARDNNNLSSAVARAAWKGSRSFVQAVTSATLTIGGDHGPIVQARDLFRSAKPADIDHMIQMGQKIPGFGNSFFKDRIDPAFQPVADLLQEKFTDAWVRIVTLRNALAQAGKSLFPNAAILSAAVCEVLGVPDGIEPLLFLLPRLPVWALLIVRDNQQK